MFIYVLFFSVFALFDFFFRFLKHSLLCFIKHLLLALLNFLFALLKFLLQRENFSHDCCSVLLFFAIIKSSLQILSEQHILA